MRVTISWESGTGRFHNASQEAMMKAIHASGGASLSSYRDGTLETRARSYEDAIAVIRRCCESQQWAMPAWIMDCGAGVERQSPPPPQRSPRWDPGSLAEDVSRMVWGVEHYNRDAVRELADKVQALEDRLCLLEGE